MANEHDHWKIGNLPFGVTGGIEHTYTQHLRYTPRRLAEITSALGSPYPHFHAVLTPERNFLLAVMSMLVTHASIPSREHLIEHTERLYTQNVEDISLLFRGVHGYHLGIANCIEEDAKNFFRAKRERKTYAGELHAFLEKGSIGKEYYSDCPINWLIYANFIEKRILLITF